MGRITITPIQIEQLFCPMCNKETLQKITKESKTCYECSEVFTYE